MPAGSESFIPNKAEFRPAVERRAESRVRLNSSFAMARLSNEGGLAATEEVRAVDLTSRGIRIIVDRAAKPGDRAVLQLVDSSGSVNLVGLSVVHSELIADGGCLLGARFVMIPGSVVRRSLLGSDGALVDLNHRQPPTARAAG